MKGSPRSAVGAVLLGSVSLVLARPTRAQLEFDSVPVFRSSGGSADSTLGDFDADGRLDLVVGDNGALHCFLGNGDGTFGSEIVTPVAGSTSQLHPGDFDGDGRLDLVAYDGGIRGLRLYSGDGTGGFALTSSLAPFGWRQNHHSIEVGDVNEDGVMDAVAVRYKGVSVLLGSPSGWVLGAGWTMDITCARLADVDLDGHLDVTVTLLVDGLPARRYDPSLVGVFRGDGAGGFAGWQVGVIDPEALAVREHLVADCDGDGVPDLVALDVAAGVFVLRGDRSGRFQPWSSVRQSVFVYQPLSAEFSGDGAVDLWVRDSESRPNVLVNDGNGAFSSPQPVGSASPGLDADAVGDVDGDRHADVVLAGRESFFSAVNVLLNRTPGRCAAGTVDAARGRFADVLFVNGSAGGSARRVLLASADPLSISVGAPPAAAGLSPFALYAWAESPARETERRLPYGIGLTCLPTPLSGADASLPSVVWNNTGSPRLGRANRPSSPAPSVVVLRPSGAGRAASFYLQGIIRDPGSAADVRASVTNGIAVEIR